MKQDPYISTCALVALCLLALPGCGDDLTTPVDACANLRTLRAESGSRVRGNFGVLDSFTFSGDERSGYEVIPPDASPCAQDIAVRLEGACRVCDAAPNACEETVTSVLSQPTEHCSACGDGSCGPGEDPNSCPEDCASACGNGTCSGDEDAQSCPQDCNGGACGNNTCEAGESPTSCPQDCSPPCGDSMCTMGETPLRCPQDCGGCTPNSTDCDGPSTQVTCNPDGMSVTRRACGAGNTCRQGSCQSDAEPPDNEVEALLLGQWQLLVRLIGDNDVERSVEVGNVLYGLEIFAVDEPAQQFGLWSWRGALTARSFCVLTEEDFQAGDGDCVSFQATQLGSCSGASCTPVREVAARGDYDAVSQQFRMHGDVTTGDTFFMNDRGYLQVRLEPTVSGPLSDFSVLGHDCERSCSWSTSGQGDYAEYGYGRDYQWRSHLIKIDE